MEPVRPEESGGVCGVDEEDGLTMETAEEEKEKVYKGIEVEKIGKEGDKRDMRKLIDPRKPTEEEVSEHELIAIPKLVSSLCDGEGQGARPSEVCGGECGAIGILV